MVRDAQNQGPGARGQDSRVRLDAPVRLGPETVAAVVHRDHARPWRAHRGEPVALLVSDAGRMAGFSALGDPLSVEEIEALCPGATETLASAAGLHIGAASAPMGYGISG